MNNLNYKTERKSHSIYADKFDTLQEKLDKWLQKNEDVNIISVMSMGKILWDYNLLIVYEKIVE